MPTPSDVLPIAHESIANRTTCPPEEARSGAAHELNASRHGEPTFDAPMQSPTPPPQDPLAGAQLPPDAHNKPSSAHIEAPSRDVSTPMTVTDDGAEERTSQASPLAATASVPGSLLPNHLSSPFPAHRVRKALNHVHDSFLGMLTSRAVPSKQFLLPPPPWKPLQGQPNLRPTAIRSGSGGQIC
jgi:hypothetical protein